VKRSAVLLGLALVALCLLGVSSAANAPLAGNLDPSFGKGGVVTQSHAGIGAIAVQPDGKIVVAGRASPATGVAGFALARYLPDGSLDPSFGDGGFVVTNLYPQASYAFIEAIAQQAGKIVVAGTSDGLESENVLHQFTLARYNRNGSLDTSFGTNGITNTAIPEPVDQGVSRSAGAYALAVLPNGEILAAGSAGWEAFPPTSSFALARYTPDGSLDPTFGAGGIAQTMFDGYDSLAGITVQPDGGIVATGGSYGPGHGNDWNAMALARYEPDGSLDRAFGTGGTVTTAHKLDYAGGPSALQNGKIVVAGSARLSGNHFFPVLARYKETGRIDSTFGTDGFAKIKRVTGLPSAILTQSDRKILITVGHSVIRLLPDGRLDTSFGRRGIVSLGDGFSTLALQTDQKILVGGGDFDGNASRLARLIGGNNCAVPDLRGKTVSKARAALETSYCRSGRVSKRSSSKVDRGRVIATAPQRGARLPGGARVELVVSRGKP
jgi:uncharacterized delta-60 repeat protein